MKEFNQTYNDAFSAVSDLTNAAARELKLYYIRHYRKEFQHAAEVVNNPDAGNPVQVVFMAGGVVLFYYKNEFTRNIGGDVRAVATIGKHDNGGVKIRLLVAD